MVRVPDSTTIHEVVANLREIDASKMSAATENPRLLTGLNHWSLWLLICLSRHISRQKWVGYIVETRLRGDLHDLGNQGAFGHPEGLPQRGTVPDFPGWTYYFHGRGCCLTNDVEGMEIDVDFDDEGSSTRIDTYFYTNFLDALKSPEFPESILKKPSPIHNFWQQDLNELKTLGCWDNGQVTELGMQLCDALAPIIDHFTKLQSFSGCKDAFQLLHLALHLGDYILADRFASENSLSENVVSEIKSRSHSLKSERAEKLSKALTGTDGKFGIPLQALAELGPEFSKKQTVDCLFRTPVDGAANTALGILNFWQQEDFDSSLEKLVEFRLAETEPSLLSRIVQGKLRQNDLGDDMPCESQLTQAARLILLRHNGRPNAKLSSLLIKVLKKMKKANRGKAALYLYLLDKQAGFRALEQSLFSEIPMANYEATAACVLIGTEEAERLLIRALDCPKLEQQHAAACALSRFPSRGGSSELANWKKRQDGIADPLGKETRMGDRVFQSYSMSDVAHANMQQRIDWYIESFRDFTPLINKA